MRTGSSAEALDRAGAGFDGVVDRVAEHLVAAADAEDRRARRGARRERAIEPRGAQPREILDGRLRPRHDDEVGALDVGRRAREAHPHAGLRADRVEVGEVAHPAQPQDGDVERVAARGGRRLGRRRLERERVLDVHPEILDERQHAEHRAAGARAEVVQAGREDRLVAAELVDHEARDERLVGGLEQRERAEQRREDAAAVDVADDEHRQAGGAREPHVRDVAGAQVDLRRAAGALADDDVVARAQVGERALDDRPQLRLQLLVGARVGVGVRLAHHDDLAVARARRLDQDRVHRGLGLDPGRRRLHGLRASDLRAARRDDGVQRHVLRLERRHRDAAAAQPATEPGRHDGLARVGVRAADEQRAAHRSRTVQTAAPAASAAAPTRLESRFARAMSVAAGAAPSPSAGRCSTRPP